MEEKRLNRRCLKWRILKSISLILAVSMIISTMTGYRYFENVVRNQKISDEESRLLQLSDQMTFITEDIGQFSRSILIDEEIQRFLEEKEDGNEFHRQRLYYKMEGRLSFYSSLRPYIMGIILCMEDGTFYGSSYSALDTAYIREKLEKKEISKYNGGTYQYSDPYYDAESFSKNPMICYQVQMFDKYHFKEQKGTLYIEINFDYFLNQIRLNAQAEEYICLLGRDGAFLYEQGSDEKLQHCLKEAGSQMQKVQKTKEGYLIWEPIGGTDWKLYTLVTNDYLWVRSRFVFVFFLLSFLFSICLILLFISRRMETMLFPITELSEKMAKIEYGKIEEIQTVHTGDEIENLYECFKMMLLQLQKGEEERIQYERQRQEMEYDIMLSQINPHYLYNVLNTVVYLASVGKNQDVVKIVHALIYTLHDTLKIGEGSVETTIEKELALTRSYLDIQKYRYPDRFTVEFQCKNNLMNCKVPKTVIQPLVENAILHGILPAEKKGTVQVCVFVHEGGLCIQVDDDGIGIQKKEIERFLAGEDIVQAKSERKHIGISNVRDRIRYLYGEKYGMEVEQKADGGTKIALYLPYELEETDEEEIW